MGRHGLDVSGLERIKAAAAREAARREAEGRLVQVAVPAILAGLLSSLPSLLHVILLCDSCRSGHFQARPEQPGYPCHLLECECWCTRGTGQ